MKNWLGQHLDVGNAVWRGARDGNSSSFKAGRIIKLNPEKGTARVRWQVEPRRRHFRDINGAWARESIIYPCLVDSQGSPSIDSLVKIASVYLLAAVEKAENIQAAIDSGAPDEVIKGML